VLLSASDQRLKLLILLWWQKIGPEDRIFKYSRNLIPIFSFEKLGKKVIELTDMWPFLGQSVQRGTLVPFPGCISMGWRLENGKSLLKILTPGIHQQSIKVEPKNLLIFTHSLSDSSAVTRRQVSVIWGQ
jgi:hypothetical protein